MKAIGLILVIALALVAFGLTGSDAKAAGAFTYTSSINLQNLENATANITVTFYNQNGSVDTSVNDTITANGSKVFFPIPATEGFNGSVIVSSDRQVASISNVLGDGGAAAAAYVAMSTGSKTALIPVLMYQNGGFSTWFNVQNTGGNQTTVNVTYSDGKTASATVPIGASATFDQTTEGHTAKTFSAVVTSAEPVAVTVIEESSKIMFAYNGLPDTAAVAGPVMPLVQANNSGYQTGITIQNNGDQATDVTITYYPSPNAGTQCTEKRTIAAKNQKSYMYLPFQGVAEPNDTSLVEDCAVGKFVGSAKVTGNSANQPLVAVVNQLKSGVNGEAYTGFDPAGATGTVILPLIMNANGGYFTSINISNAGSGTTTVTCAYTGSTKTDSATLDPGKGISFLQPNTFGAGVKYVGGATCTANNSGKILAIVNQLGPSGTADQLLVYEGISMP